MLRSRPTLLVDAYTTRASKLMVRVDATRLGVLAVLPAEQVAIYLTTLIDIFNFVSESAVGLNKLIPGS